LGFEALARVCCYSKFSAENLLTSIPFQILEICYKSGVKVVTIYAFSIENFKRSKYEVDALMDMAKVKLVQLAQHGDLLDRYGASIRILGQRDLLKPDVLEAIDKAASMTRNNKEYIAPLFSAILCLTFCSAVLNICFPYTSRDEITSAIRTTVEDFSKPLYPQARPFSQTRITQKIRTQHLTTSTSSSVRGTSPTPSNTSDADDSISSSTTLHPDSPPNDVREHQGSAVYPDPETITASTIDNNLFTARDPPLDLLVRTSGVKRLSDFMLWQCHEDTEIVFLDCLWPEFDLRQFLPVLVEWQWRRKYIEEKERPFNQGRRSNLMKVR
jgi:ditrans,polycis-polyprenyl diphosphate synthase